MPVGFEGGRQPLIRQLPKNRGFKSVSNKPLALRLERVAKAFADGTPVTLPELKKRNLVAAGVTRVKIVSGAPLSAKLTVRVPVTTSVAKAVEAAGGSVR
jgi:ribosomal protein L15